VNPPSPQSSYPTLVGLIGIYIYIYVFVFICFICISLSLSLYIYIYIHIYIYIYMCICVYRYISEVGGMSTTGKSFRVVPCVACVRARGLVA
jgi:hypothetical protein